MIDTIIAKDAVPCGCGRSATGFCTGLHALSDEEWDARVFDEAFKEYNVDGSNSTSSESLCTKDSHRHIIHAIELCQPREHSWFKGFCDLLLSGRNVSHDDRNVNDNKFKMLQSRSEIIFINDEHRSQHDSEFFRGLKNEVLVVGNPVRYQELLTQKTRVVYFPWLIWFLNLLPWRQLGIYPKKSRQTDKVFNFLNRRWHPGRYHLIVHLLTKHLDLIDQGYITANQFNFYQDFPLLYRDTGFEAFYQDGGIGYELNNTKIANISCSVVLQNIFYVGENIPGQICIQVESAWADQIYNHWITEKSMLAFATQQIPIIVSQFPGIIDFLRNQGFDVFDDIVDHGYDKENDYLMRLESAIALNKKVLSGETSVPEITERLIANQRYLLGEWLEKTSLDLINKIEFFFNSKEDIT